MIEVVRHLLHHRGSYSGIQPRYRFFINNRVCTLITRQHVSIHQVISEGRARSS